MRLLWTAKVFPVRQALIYFLSLAGAIGIGAIYLVKLSVCRCSVSIVNETILLLFIVLYKHAMWLFSLPV